MMQQTELISVNPNHDRRCCLDNCNLTIFARGLCRRHYDKQRYIEIREQEIRIRNFEIPQNYNEIIHSRREALGITQAVLSRLSGYHPATIAYYDSGNVLYPKPQVYRDIIAALDRQKSRTLRAIDRAWNTKENH